MAICADSPGAFTTLVTAVGFGPNRDLFYLYKCIVIALTIILTFVPNYIEIPLVGTRHGTVFPFHCIHPNSLALPPLVFGCFPVCYVRPSTSIGHTSYPLRVTRRKGFCDPRDRENHVVDP